MSNQPTPRSPLKSIPEFFRDWVMSKSVGGGDSIMLRTPPKKLSLDDSNYFNERLKDYKNEFKQNNLPDFEEEIDSRVTSGETLLSLFLNLIVTYYSSINHLDLDTTIFEADYEKEANLSLDEMSETDKLRNQMFKVNRKSFIHPFNESFKQIPTFNCIRCQTPIFGNSSSTSTRR